jgi:hypothetical protein
MDSLFCALNPFCLVLQLTNLREDGSISVAPYHGPELHISNPVHMLLLVQPLG